MIDLNELNELYDAATPGEWSRYGLGGITAPDQDVAWEAHLTCGNESCNEDAGIVTPLNGEDAALIVALHNAYPALANFTQTLLNRHRPDGVYAMNSECFDNECEHEDGDCPEHLVTICRACWDIAESVDEYFAESRMENVRYPCPTVQAAIDAGIKVEQ